MTAALTIRGRSVIVKHPAHKYAMDVCNGAVPACKWVRLACARYMRDLDEAQVKGWTFDYRAADHVIQWFEQHLRHTKGQYKGQPFTLLPWQQFIVWNLFGWKKANGTRRFTDAYIEIPKKNGKTTFASGIMLYMLLGDGEDSPEVYCAATHRDQAKIAFDEAEKMAKASPTISKCVRQIRNKIECQANYGKMIPLSSDANSSDGLNVSCGVIDEYHAHKTSEVNDIVKSGTVAREQPLHMIITTAGFNLNGPCHKQHNTSRLLLEGVISDDSSFCIMHTIDLSDTENEDDGDDWRLEENWIKANPSIGHGVKLENLRKEFQQAINYGGTKITNFKTKFLNVWCGARETWIPDHHVAAVMVEQTPDLTGAVAYGGLDLSNSRDITALALRFVLPSGAVHHKTFYWLPEERLNELSSQDDRHPYIQFAREGYIQTTPGNVTDYDQVRKFITGYYMDGNTMKHDPQCLAERFKIHSIAFDRWNSSQCVLNLKNDGIEMVPFGQGFMEMSYPTKQFAEQIYDQDRPLTMDNDPVLRWMMGNVAIQRDPAGNEKPNKEKSADKIDGVVANIMAIGRHISAEAEAQSQMPTNYTLKFL